MRIGELAALAGITTRTVRHYHRIGLLPEPGRQLNGYREYSLRDAVELMRVRRLVELGLSLDEVRDALSDSAGRDLHEILAELDADLARQEQSVRERRERLTELLKRARADGRLPPEGPVSAQLAAIFEGMAGAGARRAGPEPAMAAKDRELLAMLEASAGRGHRDWLLALTRALSSDPEAMERAYEIYARLDELDGAKPDDPRVGELAELVADSMPDGFGYRTAASDQGNAEAFAEAFFADFPPAQAQVLRRAAQLLRERAAP